MTDKTPVPAVETNQASAPTVADEFWDGDLESSLIGQYECLPKSR